MWKLLADVLDYHRSLIGDRQRCEAFRAAIHASVRPGDVVIDIGAGSGLLSCFASQAGAARVYAIEEGMIADLAEVVFANNALTDRVTLVRGKASSVMLPEKADVIVSETLWNFGLGEGIVSTLYDGMTRWLKSDGRVIPECCDLFVAAVCSRQLYRRVSDWEAPQLGVDFTGVRRMAANNVYRAVIQPSMLLSKPRKLARVHFDRSIAALTQEVVIELEQPGLVHGLGGWFDAALCPGHRLSNAPPNPAPSWKQAFLPLEKPIAARAGDQLRVKVQCLADESAWRWVVSRVLPRGEEPVADHTTLGGFPTALARLRAP